MKLFNESENILACHEGKWEVIMKAHRSSMIFWALFLLAPIFMQESSAAGYLGELCWRINIQTSPTGNQEIIFKAGTYVLEGGHIQFIGRIVKGNETIPVTGQALSDGQQLIFHFTASGVDRLTGDHFGNIGNAVIDMNTLSGSFFWVGSHRTPAGELGSHHDSGTMTFMNCP